MTQGQGFDQKINYKYISRLKILVIPIPRDNPRACFKMRFADLQYYVLKKENTKIYRNTLWKI